VAELQNHPGDGFSLWGKWQTILRNQFGKKQVEIFENT